MRILFLTLASFHSLNERNIYTDLLREFVKNGHYVYAVSPIERNQKEETKFIKEKNAVILRLKIGNTQKTGSVIEKGISTVMIEPAFKRAIRQYFSNVKFDLVLYSTPPITLVSAIAYVKKRDCAKTYLLLKDIFPQNAVDIGMMSQKGVKGILYRYFRAKEKKLYRISDRIGCMSEANVKYLLRHNPEINKDKVEICPNSIEPVDKSVSAEEKVKIRKKYHIPLDRTVFVYGGNLGKPQGIPFMLKCLHSQRENDKAFFLIVGNGTEYGKIERYIEKYKPKNMKLHQWLPKEDYDKVVAASDVGMIFLDHRFTIPNFPSRLLSYMSAKIPVLAVTDPNTDIGKVITEGGFGWWCESSKLNLFSGMVNVILESDITQAGVRAFEYLRENYSSQEEYGIIYAAFVSEITF